MYYAILIVVTISDPYSKLSHLHCSPQQQAGSDDRQDVASDERPVLERAGNDEVDAAEDQSQDGDDLAPRLEAASAAAGGHPHLAQGR